MVGITEFAQSELGEIVYVNLPSVGKKFTKDEVFSSVEALKTTSDFFMRINCEVIELNTTLEDNATLVNKKSYSGITAQTHPWNTHLSRQINVYFFL